MTLATDVQTFLDFYVKGIDPPGQQLFFPGIRRRRPALVGPSIEYDPLQGDDELDQVDVETLGADAPAVSLPTEFADICGLEDVVVEDDGAGGVFISFIWCTDYPISQVAAKLKTTQRVAPLELSGQSGSVIAECLTKLRESLGAQLSEVQLASFSAYVPFEQIATVVTQIQNGQEPIGLDPTQGGP